MLEKIFKLQEKETTPRVELMAGLVTFMTMAYIVFVNPAILSTDYAGNPTGAWVYDIGPADSVMTASFWVTPVLLGKIYSLPNPFRANNEPSWGKQVIISYVPSDTVELGSQFPAFKVTIYNVAAERIRVLDSEPQEIDRYTRRAFWDLKNEKNEDVVSGMYLYVIEIRGNKVERRTGRLTIIK